MKRVLGYGVMVFSGLLLSGCPIYPHDYECSDHYDCPSGYYCTIDNLCMRSGSPQQPSYPDTCSSPYECGPNEVCGSDALCHSGDCWYWGCVAGYRCQSDGLAYRCVPPGNGAAGSAGAGNDGGQGGQGGPAGAGGQPDGGVAGTDGGDAGSAGMIDGGTDADSEAPVYCGNPSDCTGSTVCALPGQCLPGSCADLGCVNGYVCNTPDGGVASCVPQNPAACILDADCASAGIGYTCINGLCTAPSDQCSDGTQCPLPAEQACVDGKCVDTCSDDTQCDEGFACDTELSVCTNPASPCTITADCGDSALVCVAGACVPRCSSQGECPDGQTCVANGCVPDQAPQFLCSVEGQQDACSAGSICLHHSCYIACTTDADAGDSCAFNPPELSVCKPVTTSSGTYHVCGSDSNLGNECDLTAGQSCPEGNVCIDGFCR